MNKFNFFNNFNAKQKLVCGALIIFIVALILVNYNIGMVKFYGDKLVTSPTIRSYLINIAKLAIPLKNNILMRSVDDKLALLESSGSCVFCDFTQGNFKESNLKDVDLRYANLSGADLSNTNLSGADLSNTNLIGANFHNANLTGVDFLNQDLRGTILTGVNLSGVNLTGVDLSNKNLTGSNLTGVDLRNKNLTGVNLTGVDLRNKNLTGVNLTGVDLSNQDLSGTILTGVNLSGGNLTGVDLSNKNLTGVNLTGVDLRNINLTGSNLTGVDLRNINLTGSILKDATKLAINLKNPSNSNLSALNELQNLNVTRYDLNEDLHYVATKEGFLFESNNNKSRLVLDLKNDAQFSFDDGTGKNKSIERGFLGVASRDQFVYIAYSSQDTIGSYDDQFPLIEESYSLVVDEYSSNFNKVRNIIKIEGFKNRGFAGNLSFDSFGKLYLSVGDGGPQPGKNIQDNDAQNLNSLKGKILRLDVSDLKLEPEIIAYGIRNPWGVNIDSKDRMFILQCGHGITEAVYLLNDLYSGIPLNLGWPVFEGSLRTSYDLTKKKNPLIFDDVLAPIYETDVRPGCFTAGLYLDDIDLFLFGDFYGTIRLLKQQENGDWYLFHEEKENTGIWGFGLDNKTKKIFIAPKNLELEILIDSAKLNQ